MATATSNAPVLESAAQAFADATAARPFLFELPPAEGRAAVDGVQAGEIDKPAVDEEWITVPAGPTGSVQVRIVRPEGATGTLLVIMYIHGAGWVFGDAGTHDRLVRELAVGTGAAVVFPSTTARPRRATRLRSSRTTRRRAGSSPMGLRTTSTHRASQSLATLSGAI